MISLITRQYQKLAIAVIERAIIDANSNASGIYASEKDAIRARKFLNNTRELAFYADLAEVRNDLEKAGYIKAMEARR